MRRYLIVANQTLVGGPLLATIHDLHEREPSTFHVLVPATAPRDHVWSEGETRALAEQRLAAGIDRLAGIGVDATGEVGDEHPIQAIEDLLQRGEVFDAIVLSTLPAGRSRWLKLDLIHRVQGFGVQVIHVVGAAEPAPRG